MPSLAPSSPMAFIGGGNMASAIAGGLLKQGYPPNYITVVEPLEPLRQQWEAQGMKALPAPQACLSDCHVMVWAVKPQVFTQAASQVAPWAPKALHLSVMAGISIQRIAQSMGTRLVVRCMPNTPALIGQGMTGIYAAPEVSETQRQLVQSLLQPTGKLLWLDNEDTLHTITALSGSGPAYVFYFLEAMAQAGQQLGLDETTARSLAQQTFLGATALASQSQESLTALRERVTSQGGTTHAAITHLQHAGVTNSIVRAIHAAHQRSVELGKE